jgi:hypothetical protein
MIYICVYGCNIGHQDSLACQLDFWACILIVCLVSSMCNTLVQVLKYLETIYHNQESFPSPHTSSIIDPSGSSQNLFILSLKPPRATREYLSKVKVGRYSHSSFHLVDWVGIFPTYLLCDNKDQDKFFVRICFMLMFW